MASVWPLSAQWRNRYQHIGQSHHVYVEETRLDLRPIGGPSFDTWYSGDHHFHLNYGGHVLLARGAGRDVVRRGSMSVGA